MCERLTSCPRRIKHTEMIFSHQADLIPLLMFMAKDEECEGIVRDAAINHRFSQIFFGPNQAATAKTIAAHNNLPDLMINAATWYDVVHSVGGGRRLYLTGDRDVEKNFYSYVMRTPHEKLLGSIVSSASLFSGALSPPRAEFPQEILLVEETMLALRNFKKYSCYGGDCVAMNFYSLSSAIFDEVRPVVVQ